MGPTPRDGVGEPQEGLLSLRQDVVLEESRSTVGTNLLVERLVITRPSSLVEFDDEASDVSTCEIGHDASQAVISRISSPKVTPGVVRTEADAAVSDHLDDLLAPTRPLSGEVQVGLSW
jgi:hypothetical protein